MHMLRFNIVRCLFLLFYVLKKHIILCAWIQWCNKTTLILAPLPPPPSVVGGGYRISNFLMAKEVNNEVKKKLRHQCPTIKYYEHTKYALNRKLTKKIRTIVMCLSSSRKCRIFFTRNWNAPQAEYRCRCECIANSMVTFLKFLLTYIMKFVKIYSIK